MVKTRHFQRVETAMKCLLIGIALSACLSVWSGPDTSKMSDFERGQLMSGLAGSLTTTHIPGAYLSGQ